MAFIPSVELADFLISLRGATWLSKAESLALTAQSHMADLQTLRQDLSPDEAAAVLEQTLLRRKARHKFAKADTMLFVRDALEQATHHQVAAHRSGRYQNMGRVIDLGCGIGGDSLALASTVKRVVSVDLDPVRLKFANHNADVYNFSDVIRFVRADACQLPLKLNPADAIFADPARRDSHGTRTVNTNNYLPPLNRLMTTYAGQPLGVKVAPGVNFSALSQVDEIEIVSLAGEAKEAVLWFNELATQGVSRRATVLPSGATITDSDVNLCREGPHGDYLFEPDPAIIRAGLVKQTGSLLSLWQLDPEIAYLTGDHLVKSPFVTAYHIEAKLPLQIRQINRYLQQHQISRVNVKQRGTGLSPDKVAGQLKPTKDGIERTLILVRMGSEHLAFVCERKE